MVTSKVNADGSVNATANSALNSTASSKSNSSLDKDAFLQLLVAQMKYQDPMEPTDNTAYVAQLATFSQVEELKNVSTSMSQAEANSLLGSTVVMKTQSASGTESYVGGPVERIVNQDGKIYLGINQKLYDIDDLDSVVNEDFYKKYYKDKTTGAITAGGAYVDTSGGTTK